MADLSELGEFGLIERLVGVLERSAPPLAEDAAPLSIGIGDDAAVWVPSPGTVVVATTDAMVEGVHFDLRYTSWRDLGWKALATNVSDAAAMGATPRYALVTLGLRRGIAIADLEALYTGIADQAACNGIRVVGGDVVSSPVMFVSVALYAEGGPTLLRRDAARAGDVIAVTGTPGDSAAGLRILQRGASPDSPDERALARAHLRPIPRVAESRALLEVGVRCGMDLSDGLLGDATRLARSSGVRVEIQLDTLPLSDAIRNVFPAEAKDIALAGGEDYELLIAGDEGVVSQAVDLLTRRGGVQLTVVGRVYGVDGGKPVVEVRDALGNYYQPKLHSWEHPL
jgi:thiamine-monophosphate kinase